MTRLTALAALTLTLASCAPATRTTVVTPHAWPRSVPAGALGNLGVYCVEDNPCSNLTNSTR